MESSSNEVEKNYHVLTDCHDAEYGIEELLRNFFPQASKNYFSATQEPKHELAVLVEGYTTFEYLTKEDFLFKLPKTMTYLAIVTGEQEGQDGIYSGVLSRCENDSTWERKTYCKDKLMSQDYIDYLIKERGFIVTELSQVFLYRRCSVLPRVYDEIIRARNNSSNQAEIKLLKFVVNLSAGYFGFNPNKRLGGLHSCRLVSHKVGNVDISKTEIQFSGEVVESLSSIVKFFTVKTYKRQSSSNQHKNCNNALPLFVSVVQFGLLRMNQVMCFFDRHLRPNTHRHLYSNCDNFVLALSTPTLEDAVEPLHAEEFYKQKANFFSSQPGGLKLEWRLSTAPTSTEEGGHQVSEWKFASAYVMNYSVLVSENDTLGKNKNCAIGNGKLTNESLYKFACDMLEKKRVTLKLERRIDKLFSTGTQVQTFEFAPKK